MSIISTSLVSIDVRLSDGTPSHGVFAAVCVRSPLAYTFASPSSIIESSLIAYIPSTSLYWGLYGDLGWGLYIPYRRLSACSLSVWHWALSITAWLSALTFVIFLSIPSYSLFELEYYSPDLNDLPPSLSSLAYSPNQESLSWGVILTHIMSYILGLERLGSTGPCTKWLVCFAHVSFSTTNPSILSYAGISN